MPGDNNFLQFDINRLLMLSDADYNNSLTRLNGVSAGQASAALHNKLFFQMSTFVAAFAKAISDAGFNAVDYDFDTLVDSITKYSQIDKVWPIGSLYFNATNNTNPHDLLGFGTWVAFSTGKMLLGAGGGYAAGATGGEAEVTLSSDELPSHDHQFGGDDMLISQGGYESISGFPYDADSRTSGGGQHYKTKEFETRGEPHNNMPPYVVVYIWKRTA